MSQIFIVHTDDSTDTPENERYIKPDKLQELLTRIYGIGILVTLLPFTEFKIKNGKAKMKARRIK